MQLNNKLLQLIGLRFADPNYNIDFDDYLTCIVRLENMFRRLKPELWTVGVLWSQRLTASLFTRSF